MKHHLRLLLILCGLIGTSLCHSALSEAGQTVRVGHEQNHPMVSTSSEGKPQGIMIDIVEEIARREGWTLEYVPCLWNNCLENLDTGAIDLLVAIAHTPERAQRFSYNQHTVISNWGLLYSQPNLAIESYADLEGKRVAVVQNDVYSNNFIKMAQQFDLHCNLIFADNFQAVFSMIDKGEVDTGVANRFFSLLNERSFKVKPTPIIFSPVSVQVATPKNKGKEILAAFDYHLEDMKKDRGSVYHKSLNHWLGFEGAARLLPRWFWWMLYVILGSAVLLGIFVSVLRREVSRKTADLRHEITERLHSENQLRIVLDNMQEILFHASFDGTIIFISNGVEILGYHPADLKGTSFLKICKTPLEFEALRDELQAKDTVTGFRITLLRQDGSERLVSINADLLWDNNANQYSLIASGTDVTEHSRMEELMAQTEKMTMIGGLAAGMAHEINNPLGIIIQHIQNIKRRISADLPANRQAAANNGIDLRQIQGYLEQRDVLKFLRQIHEAGDRMARIINNMLTFSRKSESKKESASLEQTIEQALELADNDYDLKKYHEFRNIQIVREFAPGLPHVMLIVLEFEQVLLNLFKNAAHAMSFTREARKPCLTLRARQEKGWAVVDIEDNGPGMSEEIQCRIFEPFYTTKEVGTGTGLGLSVSHAIITNNHQGRLTVRSRPGSGACFTIHLPLTSPSGETS